ncbi:hypothetical protein PCASD_11285 [Puccinia coronata f. sp. avenae]|uniref:Uncharacterized protein n=1 Tax=Puccinia coronata f. sp. avenae TaxID=200324 RepID=A0A2N5RZN9_9BASI|nr:hypothetical protein PCASD_24668 [Puccinia coronata f. sp. avenae]PLW37739.1 hypothetical protein PCASD_11285 [Puccinia coronata f. sp. avenae]
MLVISCRYIKVSPLLRPIHLNLSYTIQSLDPLCERPRPHLFSFPEHSHVLSPLVPLLALNLTVSSRKKVRDGHFAPALGIRYPLAGIRSGRRIPASGCGCLRFWENPAGIRILVAHIRFLSWYQRGQLVGRQPGPTVSAQTVSRDQQSGLEDCQLRPTVPAGRLSAKTDGQLGPSVSAGRLSAGTDGEPAPTVSRQRLPQLTDCQLGLTVSADRLSAGTDGLS